MRQGGQNGTPLPHEEPQELNPPAGVLAYYWLKSPTSGPLKLELSTHRSRQSLRRQRHSSQAPRHRGHQRPGHLGAAACTACSHSRNASLRPQYPNHRGFGGGGRRGAAAKPPADACHPSSMPTEPAQETTSPATRPVRGTGGLEPGQYTVRLTIGDQTLSRPVTVKPDPRKLPAGSVVNDGDDDTK